MVLFIGMLCGIMMAAAEASKQQASNQPQGLGALQHH
jgi:hypothetical protein